MQASHARQKSPRQANDFDRELGRRIHDFRTLSGKSQSELAEALGVTFQQIQKYEQGKNRVTARSLVAISEFLNVDVAELLPSRRPAAYADELLVRLLNQDSEFATLMRAWSGTKNASIKRDIISLLSSIAALEQRAA